MNAKLSIVNIDPAKASVLLSNPFGEQRHMRKTYVNRLAIEMRERRWKLSPDCILLVKGQLANGQHRMAAVIESGMAAPFILMECDDEQLYKIIDAGMKRTIGDVLIGASQACLIGAAARWVINYDKQELSASHDRTYSSGGFTTRGQVIDYVEKNMQPLQADAALCLPLYREWPILPVSTAVAIMHIAKRNPIDSDRVETFFRNVYSGESRGDSSWDLRERCLKNSASKAKLPKQHIFALTIKALKSYLNGTRPGVLKFIAGEEFPRLDKAA